MARDPVRAILNFNAGFDAASLKRKLATITSSPFAFFRATFHLFAADVREGPFSKFPVSASTGRIVADLHTENFGGFRGTSGDLVYDINDFDDTAANQPYEYDLRRLMTSIILGGTESGVRIGDAVNAAETTALQYFGAIAKFAAAKKRQELAELRDAAVVRKLLKVASEKPREAFMRSLAEPGPKDRFEFQPGNEHFRVVDGKIRSEAEKRFPFYMAHCDLPPNAKGTEYAFQDIVFRYAGKGSLGKDRYAILMSKGKADFGSLRLVEWKDSSDSPLCAFANGGKRNREVYEAALAFQLVPKRYLGYVSMFNRPMQAREIGANDCRFSHGQYKTAEKLEQAASVFGGITARAHLLGSMGVEGPRRFVARSGVTEERLAHRLVAFAVAYASRVHEDYVEVKRRSAEIAKAWKA